MARVNTNFRLGLDRKQLIEAAKVFGRAEKSAKKASTKTLEQYIINQVSGKKGTKVPDFNERRKKDISSNARDFGIHDALHSVSYHTKKATGSQDNNNYLRLTIARAFRGFYNGLVTNDMIDELMVRIGEGNVNEVISGVENGDYYYVSTFEDYAEELEQEDFNRNQQAEQQAQQEFDSGSSDSSRKSKKKKRR